MTLIFTEKIKKIRENPRYPCHLCSPITKKQLNMKAVFLAYNQALTEAVNSILDRNQIRGYTKWGDAQGQGTNTGEPHFGTHTWPAMNSAILTII